MLRKSRGLKRAWVALVCGLLLFAQHVGLSHAIWHASPGAPAQALQIEQSGSDAPAPGELSRLCELDATFAQVLGAGPVGCHEFSTQKPGTHAVAAGSYRFVSSEKPSPRSRGPPALS